MIVDPPLTMRRRLASSARGTRERNRDVDAAVLREARVLDRNDRGEEVRRDRAQRNVHGVLAIACQHGSERQAGAVDEAHRTAARRERSRADRSQQHRRGDDHHTRERNDRRQVRHARMFADESQHAARTPFRVKHIARAFALALASLAVAGCHSGGPNAPGALEPVAPAPAATPPALVASFAPSGTVDSLAQIRVIFRDDLIPLERLESPDEAAVLAKFSIAPALPGHFRFLTPRMIGFQADAALPLATRVRVTIAKGLTDVHGRALANDFTWTFQTAAIALSDLPLQDDAKSTPDPGPLLPRIRLSANTELDVASLAAHGSLVPDNGGPSMGLSVTSNAHPPSPSPPPDQAFDPSQEAFSYALVPAQTLAKGVTYRIVFAPGILPARGNLASGATFQGRLRTYGALTYNGLTQVQADGDIIDSGTPQLAFSNPVDTKTLAAIHLKPDPAPGTAIGLLDDSTVGINPALLAPDTDYTVTIDATLADTFGQRLGSAAQATFRTTDLKPSVWAPTGTNLFPAAANVALNVSAVNVPNGSADARFTALQPGDVVRNDDPSGGDSSMFALPATRHAGLTTAGTPNVERTLALPLRDQLGSPAGVLAYTIASTLPKNTSVYRTRAANESRRLRAVVSG